MSLTSCFIIATSPIQFTSVATDPPLVHTTRRRLPDAARPYELLALDGVRQVFTD